MGTISILYAYRMALKFGRQLRLGWGDEQLHRSRPIFQAPQPCAHLRR
ncbi:uncharacterized protein CLUP02_07579 [Colletotrichum lupini]|uniref:Uncharacterized protein n=1 Tax=Colletotrichum lupini TaxID=145971 RepID=A0A9Q8SRG4_9PEZI|nr:uncharacterized protein CLUP02_07579 [Colletotrichum lupini]UQC82093.1 hypothetical protein CLUP02_07579 [Colletotrichum lupini]